MLFVHDLIHHHRNHLQQYSLVYFCCFDFTLELLSLFLPPLSSVASVAVGLWVFTVSSSITNVHCCSLAGGIFSGEVICWSLLQECISETGGVYRKSLT